MLLMPKEAIFLNTLNTRTRPIQQYHSPACHSIKCSPRRNGKMQKEALEPKAKIETGLGAENKFGMIK